MGTDMSSAAQILGTNNVRGRRRTRDRSGIWQWLGRRRGDGRTGREEGFEPLCARPLSRAQVDAAHRTQLGHDCDQVVSCCDSQAGSQAPCTHSTAQRNTSCSMLMAMGMWGE